MAATLTLVGTLAFTGAANAAGAAFDSSGAVQLVGSTVVVSAGPVEQLDLRWKLARATPVVAVVVPVDAAASVQGVGSASARTAANTTSPQHKSFLLRPWLLAGDDAHDALAAQEALDAPTQPVRVSAESLVVGKDLAATLVGAGVGIDQAAASAAATQVTQRATRGSRFAVAVLRPQGSTQLNPGWVGTLRLTVRGGVVASTTPPQADGQPARVSVPLPGGILGAVGPQVLAVTAAKPMRAANSDNVAPLVTGVDHGSDGRWQTVLYGLGAGQAPAQDFVEPGDATGAFHAVQPVLLPDMTTWPWLVLAAMIIVLAAVVLRRGRRKRG